MASFVQPSKVKINTGPVKNSFASVLKSNDHKGSPSSDSSSAIVMDDSCIVDNDLSCSLMGKIKDINALSNIYVIFAGRVKTELCGYLLEGLPFKPLGIIMHMRKLSPTWAPEFNNKFCENSSSDEESMEDGELLTKVDDI
ncbi:hypothetical protein Tco_0682155 [Tanacetum coccineum]|uniref:Uncharacterized protein n=1 Tax=Tanacetum coccineum TaxID=301880 RepID=A0ABQ4XRW8_9ASTR